MLSQRMQQPARVLDVLYRSGFVPSYAIVGRPTLCDGCGQIRLKKDRATDRYTVYVRYRVNGTFLQTCPWAPSSSKPIARRSETSIPASCPQRSIQLDGASQLHLSRPRNVLEPRVSLFLRSSDITFALGDSEIHLHLQLTTFRVRRASKWLDVESLKPI